MNAYREVLGNVLLHEADVSSVSWASAVLVNLVLITKTLRSSLGNLLCLEFSVVSLRGIEKLQIMKI